jgi:hypothetical protein
MSSSVRTRAFVGRWVEDPGPGGRGQRLRGPNVVEELALQLFNPILDSFRSSMEKGGSVDALCRGAKPQRGRRIVLKIDHIIIGSRMNSDRAPLYGKLQYTSAKQEPVSLLFYLSLSLFLSLSPSGLVVMLNPGYARTSPEPRGGHVENIVYWRIVAVKLRPSALRAFSRRGFTRSVCSFQNS